MKKTKVYIPVSKKDSEDFLSVSEVFVKETEAYVLSKEELDRIIKSAFNEGRISFSGEIGGFEIGEEHYFKTAKEYTQSLNIQ